MKEIILEKLNQIEDLEQRRMLRDIMSSVFTGLIDYQEQANQTLEERIFNEIPDEGQKSVLYFAVSPRDQIDPIDDFLYPVFPEEAAEPQFDLKEMAEKLAAHETVPLFPIFLECPYPKICELLNSPRLYQGELVTTTGKYPIQIKLEPSLKYAGEIERLYQVFQRNGIPWKTVNNPYANKFFEVGLTGFETAIEPLGDSEVKEISFDLGEFEPYKKSNVILLWNIERLLLKTSGYPVPALDNVNFEHPVAIAKYGTEHQYLVDEDEQSVKYISRSAEELTVVAPEQRNGMWHILKITQPGVDMKKYPFPVLSNQRKTGFITGFAQKQGNVIHTKGEIIRLVNVFTDTADFELLGITILDRREGQYHTYDCNHFIIDDIRVANDKKVLRLQFKTARPEDFLRYDLLSFLVSEVQRYFPEYDCVGELI